MTNIIKPTELHKLTYVLKCREVAEAMCVHDYRLMRA